MNQQELSNLISPDFITWESIKQLLLANESVFSYNGYPITDENIIFSKCIIVSPPSDTSAIKPFSYVIQSNEFAVLLSKSFYFDRSDISSFDLTATSVRISYSNIGQIFIQSFNTDSYRSESYSFLLFRIN